MGILRDFEQRLEGAVEGFFAKLFRSGLQPVELAKALQRYAGNYQQVGVAGVIVPNVYRIDLAPDDHERFSGFEASLKRELAEALRQTARDRGWQLEGPVRIELRTSEDISVGTYELRGKIKAEEPSSAPPAPRPAEPGPAAAPGTPPPGGGQAAGGRAWRGEDFSGQAVERTTVMGAAQPTLHLLNGSDPGRKVKLDGELLIGRLPECDLQLDDPSVSRRHARLTEGAGGWTIEDLDSTNGVRVNGTTVRQTSLSEGDTIELGTIRLTFASDG